MKKRTLLSIMALFIALTLVFASASVALADNGGVPNGNASNGAAHANENSSHIEIPPTPGV